MKALFYLFLVGILICAKTPLTFAQKMRSNNLAFSRGSWQIGLKEGYGFSPLLGNRNTTQLVGGYYVVNRLLIGLASSYTRELAEPVLNKNAFSTGPLIRYQFISGRISPFAELAYQFGRRSTNLEQSISFTPGLSIGLVTGLRLDLGYNFQYINSGYFEGGSNQPQIGVNYLFGYRQKSE